MASVKFNLKERDSKQETLIVARVYYEGKNFKLSTRRKIKPAFWDSLKQRAKVSNKYKLFSDLNLHLDGLIVRINQAHLDFQRENISPTPTQFKNKINILERGRMTLINYFESFIESRKSKVSKNTLKHYKTCLNHLKRYCKSRNKTIDFQDIDLPFYYDFLNYFYDSLGSSVNTAGKHISVLKVLLNEATEQGINKNLSFRSTRFQTPNFSTDYIYLTINELDTLYFLEIESERLKKVRDVFLIGCYTGLRFSDFSVINTANIKTLKDEKGNNKDVIYTRTMKTKTRVAIPINSQVKSILKKYTKEDFIKLPVISNQKMNKYLKELCRIAGITKKVEVTKSEAGKPIRKVVEKCELVITHTARSTFISNAYIFGIPEKSIMQLTGITSKTTLQRYNRLSVEENALIVSNNPLFR